METFNIISFGKRFENLALSLQQMVIGSKLGTFQENVVPGSKIFLHCEGKIWGLARVSGAFQYSQAKIWPNDIYPNRYPITVDFLTRESLLLANGVFNAELRKDFGSGWAYKFIFSPRPLPLQIGRKIEAALKQSAKCTVSDFLLDLANLSKVGRSNSSVVIEKLRQPVTTLLLQDRI